MDHEFLDQKVDFFAERDDAYSSVKHDFSRIFHENNLHSFTNATDIGFLEFNKLATQNFSGEYEDIRGIGDSDNAVARPYAKEEAPYLNMNLHNSYSPMRFMQPNIGSNVNFSTSFTNPGYVAQKQQPVQDPSMYQSYQPYKYTDYPYLDYTTQQPNNMFPQNVYDIYNPPDILDTHPNNPLSLMWSNEATKSHHKKSASTEDPLQMLQTGSHQRFGSVSIDQQASKKQTPFKIEQDFEKVSNKTLGLQIDRASKQTPESSSNNNSSGPRRTNRISKPVFNNSAIHEGEESASDDDKDDSYGDSKSRSSRGLRVLSLKVRDIVSKKKKTSYKEVAEALLQDLSQKLKGKSQAEISKEEQNVKRRVYDALNVLIAADILRKEGKLVCCETSAPNLGSQNKKKVKNDKESIIEQIQEIKRRKKEKVDALQELVFKSLAIRNLVRRNKEKAEMELAEQKNNLYGIKTKKSTSNTSYATNATRIDVIQENASLKAKNQDVISFPFIVLLSSSPENSMNLNMDTSQRQLSIESKKAFNIFGDIDVLLKMRLHYVSRDIFEKDIPKELRKYVSQSFVDALK